MLIDLLFEEFSEKFLSIKDEKVGVNPTSRSRKLVYANGRIRDNISNKNTWRKHDDTV